MTRVRLAVLQPCPVGQMARWMVGVMMTPRILALSGSVQPLSISSRLLDSAIAGAQAWGAEVTHVALVDYELPLYEAEWEAEHGLPEAVRDLQALVAEHHGLLISSPDQNGGYTALLKNGIDWISRPDDYFLGRPSVFPGKMAAILSASSHPSGELRPQPSLVMVLYRLGVLIMPNHFSLDLLDEVRDRHGAPETDGVEARARTVGLHLAQLSSMLSASPRLAPSG
jgi:chromate reductase, NAD(P)H dehydrogenase (quinone)